MPNINQIENCTQNHLEEFLFLFWITFLFLILTFPSTFFFLFNSLFNFFLFQKISIYFFFILFSEFSELIFSFYFIFFPILNLQLFFFFFSPSFQWVVFSLAIFWSPFVKIPCFFPLFCLLISTCCPYLLELQYSIMVSKLVLQDIMRKFSSHWMLQIFLHWPHFPILSFFIDLPNVLFLYFLFPFFIFFLFFLIFFHIFSTSFFLSLYISLSYVLSFHRFLYSFWILQNFTFCHKSKWQK